MPRAFPIDGGKWRRSLGLIAPRIMGSAMHPLPMPKTPISRALQNFHKIGNVSANLQPTFWHTPISDKT
jgi:hypothetical protein